MKTIRFEDFGIGKVDICRSDDVEGAVYMSPLWTKWTKLDGCWYSANGANISPKEARSIAKALLKVADDVEKEQKEWKR